VDRGEGIGEKGKKVLFMAPQRTLDLQSVWEFLFHSTREGNASDSEFTSHVSPGFPFQW
jgi:hypothetical protein